VQKYKKLRAAHHKYLLLHLAGKTSLRWFIYPSSVVDLSALLYPVSGGVCPLAPVFDRRHQTEVACIVMVDFTSILSIAELLMSNAEYDQGLGNKETCWVFLL
jgi:hypothetical protein